MTPARTLALIYAAILFSAASINYIPGLTHDDGLAFGIFHLDPFDDALHVASGLWALIAGLLSHRAARMFLILFGAAYLGDGVFGLFTGWGYLDFAIFREASLGPDFSYQRIAANLPHIGLGGIALVAGLMSRRA